MFIFALNRISLVMIYRCEKISKLNFSLYPIFRLLALEQYPRFFKIRSDFLCFFLISILPIKFILYCVIKMFTRKWRTQSVNYGNNITILITKRQSRSTDYYRIPSRNSQEVKGTIKSTVGIKQKRKRKRGIFRIHSTT